jgi:hypothetical protein
MAPVPLKCHELKVARWLPGWCRTVCARTGTKLSTGEMLAEVRGSRTQRVIYN